MRGSGNGNGEPRSHENHARRQATRPSSAAWVAMPDRDSLTPGCATRPRSRWVG
jgi:hypothetical protein